MRRITPEPRVQAIDDMTGFKVDHATLKKQWDGAMTVSPDRRNPQDLIRTRARTTIIANPRPEPADVFLATNITLEDGFTPIVCPDGSPLMTEGHLNGEGL